MTQTLENKPVVIPNQRPLDWLDYDFTIIKNHQQIEAYLLAAYTHASIHSIDPSTQLGSVLVAKRGDKEYTLLGVNAPSRGLNPTPEQLQDRSLKMLATIHSEVSSVCAAASAGFATKGAALICPWYSCPDCAKVIVGANIKKVVGHLQMFRATPDRWKPAIAAGMQILAAGGVEMCLFDGPVGGADDVSIRFNGEMFWPGRCLDIITS